MYKSKLLQQQDNGKFNRRDFLKLGGVAGGGALLVLGLKNSQKIIDYLTHLGEEEFIVGKDEKGLYAEFRGNNFRVVSGTIPKEQGLDGVLYELNHAYNPNFKIKGNKLARLKDLFDSLNEIPISNLEHGVEKHFKHKAGSFVNLEAGCEYLLPVYDLNKK